MRSFIASLAAALALVGSAFAQADPPADPPADPGTTPGTSPGTHPSLPELPDWPRPTGPGAPGWNPGAPGVPGWDPANPGAPGWNPGVPGQAPGWTEPSRPARVRPSLPPMAPLEVPAARALLDPLLGAWSLTIRMYADPARPPTQEQGSSEFERVMEGSFVREDFKATIAGAPYAGMGFTGFDSSRNQFTMVWLDADKGSATTARGVYDSATSTFTFLGELDEPGYAEPLDTKTTLTVNADGSMRYAFYYVSGSAETKAMEIDYARPSKP